MQEEQGRRELHVMGMAGAQRGLPFPRLVSLSTEVEGSVREQGGRNTWRWRSGKTEFEFLLSGY